MPQNSTVDDFEIAATENDAHERPRVVVKRAFVIAPAKLVDKDSERRSAEDSPTNKKRIFFSAYRSSSLEKLYRTDFHGATASFLSSLSIRTTGVERFARRSPHLSQPHFAGWTEKEHRGQQAKSFTLLRTILILSPLWRQRGQNKIKSPIELICGV